MVVQPYGYLKMTPSKIGERLNKTYGVNALQMDKESRIRPHEA